MFNSLQEQLFAARTVLIHGPLSGETVTTVTAMLTTMTSVSDAPITVHLNAPGGTAEAGDALYDVVRFVGPRVLMVATGAVEGAGALLYVAVPRQDRFSLPHARFGLRQPDLQAPAATEALVATAEAATQRRQRLVETFAEATGQPPERVEADLRRAGFMSAEDARAYGLVGQIIARLDELPLDL